MKAPDAPAADGPVYTDDALIAQQARQIALLETRLMDFEGRVRNVRAELYCIGGPLNDNREQFTREQLRVFFEIAKRTEGE